MRNPLYHRYPRELRNNLGKYLGLFLMMVFAVSFTSGFLLAAGSIERIVLDMKETYCIEDGRFACDFEPTDKALDAVRDLGVTLYPDFYKQVELTLDEGASTPSDAITARVYPNRTQVNLPAYAQGRAPEALDEVAFDRVFCENHHLSVGDAVTLSGRRVNVPTLDAAAIAAAFVQGDATTASETMFLLDAGELMEDYTRARSENELIYSLLSVSDTAARIEHGQETCVPANELEEGDLVVVRTGQPVPIDGTVTKGIAMVNQAALTGEPLPVERTTGDSVYAGTAVDAGEIFVRVDSRADKTRLRSIVSLVEQSEGRRSQTEERRERLANSIVPWNFLLAAVVALTTRDITKTAASLMVDYSCALKLTGSVSVLSAMSEGARHGFTVKGSRHFEEIAQADTIVFDKTGTLTEAVPRVRKVLAMGGSVTRAARPRQHP